MKRFLRKALRWTAILLAILGALLLVFYAEEDWRGTRDWATCQRDLAAKGETLDLRQLIPPGNPTDDLSKAPIFQEMYRAEQDYEQARKAKSSPNGLITGMVDNLVQAETRMDRLKIDLGSNDRSKIPKLADYRKGESTDLAAWQKFFHSNLKAHLPSENGTAPDDVLRTLRQFDPELNETDSAVSNPNAYWPHNYDMPFQEYLGAVTSMIDVAKILQLRATAYLENKQMDLAEKDYLFSFRLCQPLTRGPFYVHYLVIAAVRTIDDSILWEGLRRHVWNDTQLHEMESALASTDMVALAAQTLRNNRASFLKAMDVAQTVDTISFRRLKAGNWFFPPESAIYRPLGWWNQDRCIYSRGTQRDIEGLDLEHETLSTVPFLHSEIPRSGPGDNPNLWSHIYIPMSAHDLPVVDSMSSSIARAETYRRLARLACRLEEYRLAHNNQYPEKLDDLPDLPAHLNQEVLSEQPLHYQRKGDGYLLYSLGWNQKDDGGAYSTDAKEGDWPWPSP